MSIVGVQTICFPSQHRISARLVAVLVLGQVNDVACYIGEGEPEWVSSHGSKISLREAKTYFPHIERELEQQGLTYRGPRE